MKQTILTVQEVASRAFLVAEELLRNGIISSTQHVKIYGVPRGGIPAAYALAANLTVGTTFVSDPRHAHIIIDDIIDSGETRQRYLEYGKPFRALVDKFQDHDKDLGWVVFPWEGSAESGIEDNIVRLLQYVGEDPSRGGLKETPSRVAKAWKEYTSGYGVEPREILKEFEDGGERYDEMVLVRDIQFYSHCEHHLAPFFGTADVAYVPNGRIVGLSKLARLTDIFARRLQVQERMTNQIVEALVDNLQPKGAAVRIKARHMCMECRGVRKIGSETITTALRGVFKEKDAARAEFLAALR